MTAQRRNPRLARWALPVGAVALTGIVLGGYAISGAQAAPALPARTPVQLLASISSAKVPPPMTAVVQESTALGLPALPDNANNPLSALSWLTGTHTVKIWYADPAHVRIAVPVQMGETDIRRDGRDVWFWDSQGSRATHLVLPAAAAHQPETGLAGPSGPAPSPQQVAQQILKAVGPTTKVSLQQNVMIAGQPAYQLSLAPRDSRSLIGQITIAVDAQQALPLRVQVFARGASSPAVQVGYTSLQFGRPEPANFAFTPPPGAKVKTITVPSGGPGAACFGPPSGLPGVPHGFPPAAMPGQVRAGHRIMLRGLPVGPAPPLRIKICPGQISQGQVSQGVRLGHLPKGGKILALPRGARPGSLMPAGFPVTAPAGARALGPGGPTVLGKDWLTVIAFPASVPAPPGPGPGGKVVFGTPGPGGRDLAILGDLLHAARPVHGSWGSGRLLTTSLVSALLTNDGTVLIGAVQPSVLYADAARLR